MKKKLVSLFLAMAMMVTAVAALAACETVDNDIDGKIETAQKMSTAELLAKAKEETGDFIAYGNTSRITAAMDAFKLKYKDDLDLTSASASKKNDSEIYTNLQSEFVSVNNSKGASMVMIQDGATLELYRQQSKMLKNYIPKSMAGKVGQDDLVPLVQQYINKLFIWNSTGDNVPAFTNVWQLTEAGMKNKIYFKSPSSEQVNMNFLIMLTKEEWATKLASAYKEYFGKDIVLGTYTNAGYKWVAEFLANANFSITSDTTIAQDLSKPTNAGNLGLFVLSKLRDSSVTQANLQVGAWAKDTQGQDITIKPFAGFMYPMYCQLAANGPRPYTAMLFIEFLMQEEGFEAWNSFGAYSTNSDISIVQGDSPLTFWKTTLVVEDAAYIKTNKANVTDFINKAIAGK